MSATTIAVVSYNAQNQRLVYTSHASRQKLAVWSKVARDQLESSNHQATEIVLLEGMHRISTQIVLRFIDASDLNDPDDFTYHNLPRSNPGVKVPNTFKAIVTFHATADLLRLDRHLKGTTLHDHLLHVINTKPLEFPDFCHVMTELDGIDQKLYWRAWEQTVYFYTRDSGLRKNWGMSIELDYLVKWCDKQGWGQEVRDKIEKLEAPKRARKERKARERDEVHLAPLKINDENFPGLGKKD